MKNSMKYFFFKYANSSAQTQEKFREVIKKYTKSTSQTQQEKINEIIIKNVLLKKCTALKKMYCLKKCTA